MTTKKKILKSSPKKMKATRKSEFPGYPLYAAADDITNRAQRVDSDLEHPKGGPQISSFSPTTDSDDVENEKNISASEGEPSSDSDLSTDDLEALGTPDLEMDGGDDEELKNRITPVDFAGTDLDIPGSEDDDQQESVGSEDEENNGYSLGGDDHNDLEEDKA